MQCTRFFLSLQAEYFHKIINFRSFFVSFILEPSKILQVLALFYSMIETYTNRHFFRDLTQTSLQEYKLFGEKKCICYFQHFAHVTAGKKKVDRIPSKSTFHTTLCKKKNVKLPIKPHRQSFKLNVSKIRTNFKYLLRIYYLHSSNLKSF